MRWVIPYTAGGGADLIARPIAQRLGEVMGQAMATIRSICRTCVRKLTALVSFRVFNPGSSSIKEAGLFYCAACVLSKRLHDRGRSGWWAALILLAIVGVWPQPAGFFDFLFVVVLVWAGVELGAMPGEAGTNRYGANPLRPLAPA